jgi:hypothetical protein
MMGFAEVNEGATDAVVLPLARSWRVCSEESGEAFNRSVLSPWYP